MRKVKVDLEFFTSLLMIGISIYGILIDEFEWYIIVFILLSIQIIMKSIKFVPQEVSE